MIKSVCPVTQHREHVCSSLQDKPDGAIYATLSQHAGLEGMVLKL